MTGWRARVAFTMVVGAAAVAALPRPALATPGQEQSATGTAVAEIVAPLTVTAVADLDFGGLALESAGPGSVTLDPANGSASYSGVRQISCGTSACFPAPARFAVTGIAGRNYRVVVPETAQADRVEGGSSRLLVRDINSASTNLPGIANRGLLDAAGNDQLMVGGTLEVPAGSTAGHYVAQLMVVVSYD